MVLSFVSSAPTNGATDFYINSQIELTFDLAIDTNTLTSNILSLIDRETGEAVPISLSLNPVDATVVVINPKNHLKEIRESLKIPKNDKPLGEVKLSEMILQNKVKKQKKSLNT